MTDNDRWLYLHKGGRTHHVERGFVTSICGRRPGGMWPRADDWRGHGTQDEYDRAAALPRCRSCLALLGQLPEPDFTPTDTLTIRAAS